MESKEKFKISAGDVITTTVGGHIRMFYIYKVIKGIRNIQKTYIREKGLKYMIVDYPVWRALDAYKTFNGYGGLTLTDYLRKIFSDVREDTN